MVQTLTEAWHWLVAAASLLGIVCAGGHAVMYKRDSRSAFAWLAFILIVPILGAVTYFVFGINRIQRKAVALYRKHQPVAEKEDRDTAIAIEEMALPELVRFIGEVVKTPLVAGNRFEIYADGEAFAPMLEAIDNARHSVTLLTYIFDHDPTGLRFCEALSAAARRGVEVRVLIDAAGDRYTSPPMHRHLQDLGVTADVFNPTFIYRSVKYANLRNHRKLIVVDGIVAFTGGMNIRHGHLVAEYPASPVLDVHFKVTGQVVASLQRVFADDWAFATEERLEGDAFFPPLEPAGNTIARVIDDGPAENYATMRWTLLGALACAHHQVWITTPYFLPDAGLITALNMAARRGVDVRIVLPEFGNLLLVQWASTAMWWQVLEAGCRIFVTPRPFDHSKLMMVDGEWSLIGSANWDPRSLRLNFELNVEAYDPFLASSIGEMIGEKIARGQEVTLEQVDARRWHTRLRDGLARLAAPYL